tara:strand:- start:775 stop:1665 length:891 start_codon:yes stop_codon:yes gene_type:complete
MSIHIHPTGLNSTLTKSGSAIVTRDLIGSFDPGVNIFNTHWQSTTVHSDGTTKAFKLLNGTAPASGSNPPYVQLDGTNDYLGGATSGYGDYPVELNISNAFTCCGWFKWSSNYHYPFALKTLDSGGSNLNARFYTQIQNDEEVMLWVEAGAGSSKESFWYALDRPNSAGGRAPKPIFGLTVDKWFYFAVSHDGSGNWKCYLNGSIILDTATQVTTTDVLGQTRDPGDAFAEALMDPTADELWIGRRSYGSSTYSEAIKIGRQHIYSARLTDSEIRQNFLASHDIYDARIYGDNYLA